MKNIRYLLIALLVTFTFSMETAFADEAFIVNHAMRGTYFVINHNHFTARDWCPRIRAGDPVVFTEGSPHGYCLSAVFINLRTHLECEVWCH